jgi:hypothetical protein
MADKSFEVDVPNDGTVSCALTTAAHAGGGYCEGCEKPRPSVENGLCLTCRVQKGKERPVCDGESCCFRK